MHACPQFGHVLEMVIIQGHLYACALEFSEGKIQKQTIKMSDYGIFNIPSISTKLVLLDTKDGFKGI